MVRQEQAGPPVFAYADWTRVAYPPIPPYQASVDTELVRDESHDSLIGGPMDNAAFTRSAEYIMSHGTRIEAWVYIPKGQSRWASYGGASACQDRGWKAGWWASFVWRRPVAKAHVPRSQHRAAAQSKQRPLPM